MLKIAYFILVLSILVLLAAITERYNYNKQRETATKLCGNEENIAYVDADTVMCKQEETITFTSKE